MRSYVSFISPDLFSPKLTCHLIARQLYSFPTIEEPVAPHPLMQHLPGQTHAATTSVVGASVPYGIGIGIGPGLPVVREGKRRRSKEDEGEDAEANGKVGEGEKDGEVQDKGKEKDGEDKVDGEDNAPSEGKKDDGEAPVADASADAKMDVDEGKNPQEEDDAHDDSDSAPALRRSNRRPLPPGTSLAHTHRQTRSSPSPTPSTSSSTASPRYRPILPDLELAHTVFAEHAAKDWCAALAAGGGQTVQGPGVNPASAGQVMMGGTGGMQREGEVVADFLYAIKVKGKLQVKIGRG